MKKISHFARQLLLVFMGCLLAACNSTAAAPATSLPQPTATVQEDRLDVRDLVANKAPSYRGITPGLSRKEDVITKIGQPNVVRSFKKFESLHYFEGAKQEFFLIENGVVQSISSNKSNYWLSIDGHEATVDDLTQTLGIPFVITPDFGFSTRVFPNFGIAVADHFVPYPYQFFAPTSLEEYRKTWGNLPLDYDPFPPIPNVEDVGIKPGHTTRDQVARLLGQPDRINHEDHGELWWYFLEPDMLGRLLISFNADGVVQNMSISPLYQVPKVIRLEDAVSRYGQPDILQLMPSFEGEKYETLAFVYLNQGVRIATRCVTRACDNIKRDAVVGQKWYFPPMTLANYQKEFPTSAFVEWYGFDQ